MLHEFSILMRNNLKFSDSDVPDEPVTEACPELLRVELRDNLLTIAEAKDVGKAGNTIYARRTMELDGGATVFTILPELPSGVRDPKFFGAIGTVVLFEDVKRRLKTTGIDKISGAWRGWTFDAEEVKT